jgi:hypothetical protein
LKVRSIPRKYHGNPRAAKGNFLLTRNAASPPLNYNLALGFAMLFALPLADRRQPSMRSAVERRRQCVAVGCRPTACRLFFFCPTDRDQTPFLLTGAYIFAPSQRNFFPQK